MRNKTLNTVLSVFLCIALCTVIFFEFKIGFGLLKDFQLSKVDATVRLTKTNAQNSITIDEVAVYPEVPDVASDGDVIQLQGHDVKVKLNGKMTDDAMAKAGRYVYSSATDSRPLQLLLECRSTDIAEFRTALTEYWRGETQNLLSFCNAGDETGTVEFYQSTTKFGNVPVIYLGGRGTYYMFIETDNSNYLVLSAQEPFMLSTDKITAHFGNPSEAPMTKHEYNFYEVAATQNTIQAMLDKDKDNNGEFINPYDDSLSSNSTYTSDIDNQIRKQMVDLANYNFDENGKSTEIGYVVDIVTSEAVKSQWVLTSTEYSYEYCGLKLSMLSGRRSSEEFVVGGNINNLIDAQRPYVIVIKYLDSNNKLLGLSVLDNRENPIAANGVATFSKSINPVRDKINIQKIASVMFEVR